MSKGAPDWVNNPETCPANNCGGEFWADVGGSAVYPETAYKSSCNHDIERCFICTNAVEAQKLTHFSWPYQKYKGGPGTYRECAICDNCYTYTNITDAVPAYVLERDYGGWWE